MQLLYTCTFVIVCNYYRLTSPGVTIAMRGFLGHSSGGRLLLGLCRGVDVALACQVVSQGTNTLCQHHTLQSNSSLVDMTAQRESDRE